MPSNNEYMNTYVKARYHRRRNEAIATLGGECSGCRSIDELEIDHIDPKQKSFCLGDALAGWSEERVQEELKKCQLLCKECHGKKHNTAKYSHGTLSSYRYCKCDECKAAKSAYNREYKKRKLASAGSS